MQLFKYMAPENGIKVLTTGRLRFTPPEFFNDLFDCRPHVANVAKPEDLDLLVSQGVEQSKRDGWKELPDHLRAVVDPATYARLAEMFGPLARQIMVDSEAVILSQLVQPSLTCLTQKMGVLCLTESPDSNRMWAHYAMNHEGLVLGFDSDHEYFHQKRTPQDDLRHLRKVEYRHQRPDLAAYDLTATEIYLVKSDEWQHEKEWRIARPPEEATTVEPTERGLLHLFSFPPSCLRSLIFGYRISRRHRRQVDDIVHGSERYKHVEIFSAQPSNTEFRLHISREDPTSLHARRTE